MHHPNYFPNNCAHPDCGLPVRYPDGIYLRGGREMHLACYRARTAHIAALRANVNASESARTRRIAA